MIEVFEFIQKVAPTDAPVLIRGESGTGKELVARAIHVESARRDGQFLGINAAALPEQLLEAELFGYRKGAFTGAVQDKEGLLTSALGGTVFLDEISRMPMSCQAKLLRAIEEREVLPVGGLQTRKIDVRFISATNADELAEIRDDLYYRLSVMEVHVPPLRERMEDVPLLAAHFLEEYGAKFNRQPMRLSAGSLEALMSYSWPGNVRELENVIQRSVIMSAGEEVTADKIWIRARSGGEEFPAAGSVPSYAQGRDRAIAGFQRRYIGELLERADGNISKASRLAGLTRAAFYAIMKKNGLWSDRRRRRR
ncbi:MAG: sigma-54 interaction domain-containing protein [Planctomycetota bacterium]|jgi:transcriptional regulator with PAS, ATPase and Fis domain